MKDRPEADLFLVAPQKENHPHALAIRAASQTK